MSTLRAAASLLQFRGPQPVSLQTIHSSQYTDCSSGLAQLFVGGTLASLVGRLWALRISISVMIIGV